MNTFRQEYRELSEYEQVCVDDVKAAAAEISGIINTRVRDQRARALAQTKLEECVMWAVKGISA